MNPASFARFSTQQIKIFRSIAHIKQSSKKYFAENSRVGRTRDAFAARNQRGDDTFASCFACRRQTFVDRIRSRHWQCTRVIVVIEETLLAGHRGTLQRRDPKAEIQMGTLSSTR